MNFTVDQTQTQGAYIVGAVSALRDAINKVDDIANVVDNMTDQQRIDYTGFSGTLVQLQSTLGNVRDLLNSDTDVQNLITLLIW